MRKGQVMCEEQKRKISLAHIGKPLGPCSEEKKLKIGLANKGKKRTIETRMLMSLKAKRGKYHTEEYKKKMSETLKGRIFSVEWRKKISEANKGKIRPPISILTRQKLSIIGKGKRRTDETKQRIRLVRLGTKRSEETKRKISEHTNRTEEAIKNRSIAQKGKRRTDETKQKIRNSRALQKNTWTSSIEIKIQNFLKEININYIAHKYISDISLPYQCDIFIPQYNLVIECDGIIYHNYPYGNEKDKIRNSELINNGYKILRLWENDIRKMDINMFKEKLVQYK